MADVLNGKVVRPVAEQSTAELVQTASEQISRLVKDEIALAKAELAEKGKHAGIGIGLFSGAGVFVFYGVGATIATLIIVFDLFLPLWLAALIWTVVLFLTAGILALFGKNQVSKVGPPEPEATIESVKLDVDEVVRAAKERSRV
ncbi:phage holin family protein [Actinoplanes sp. KI2]|uniref:phage holin family protein n=1 Tax=Actinoplanes sp. KI2 TaxID=2983315 RepID=UPI0021D5768E|nr:phage holin family protein [Actinoplanes sp. KI2]MCU7724764.1 phage holin family protein [Actinoplanes sp. KI2]